MTPKNDGTVAYISGQNEADGRFYVLRKSTPTGDKLVVIQAPPVVPAQNMDPEEATRLTPDWEREYDYGLQIIQTLLYSLEFGENNWAYLIKRRNGSWDFVHKKEQLYIISEAPWCPLVDEREIQITSWLFAEDRQGIWNGKDVDVFIAWDNAFAKQLEKTMIGYKLLIARGLENFTYPLIGHVVRSGSREICGMITEPALGRTVQNMDKSLVYSAVAQIERAGLLFTGLKPSNIMIYNGKVRFVSICSMHKQPSDKIEREKELTYWHWEQLDSIFKEMSMFGNPIPAMRCLKSSVTEIPPLPSPVRGPRFEIYTLFIPHDQSQVDQSASQAVIPRFRPPLPPLKSGQVELLVFDKPLSAHALRAPRVRLLARASLPYRRPDKLERERLAMAWQAPPTYELKDR